MFLSRELLVIQVRSKYLKKAVLASVLSSLLLLNYIWLGNEKLNVFLSLKTDKR